MIIHFSPKIIMAQTEHQTEYMLVDDAGTYKGWAGSRMVGKIAKLPFYHQ